MEKEKKCRLRELVLDRLAYRISMAEESLAMMQSIYQNWNALDREGFELYFRADYSAHFTRLTLALSELFDKSYQRNDTINLHQVLDFICANFSGEPIQQKTLLAKQFAQREFKLNVLVKLTDKEFMNLIVSYFYEEIPSGQKTGNERLEQLLETMVLCRARHFSDKETAGLLKLPKTFFEDCRELLNFAKFFAGIFSIAFLDMAFTTDGKEFILPNEVKTLNNAFSKMLKKLGFIK